MKKAGFILIATLVLITGLISCGGGKGQKKTTPSKSDPNRGQATGYATIFDGDTSLARDRSRDDARNKLVKKILGTTVSGSSVVEDYQLVSSIVESKSLGLVKNEVIIKEGAVQGNAWEVTIEGTVQIAAINDAIQKALEDYGRPKFMVLIRETFDRKTNMPGFTETEMIVQELMGDSGFEFVDAAMTQQLMKKEKQKMKNAMNGRVSKDVQQLLLNDVGAEVIIIGTAQTKDQSKTLRDYGAKNMKSKSAIIRIKAVDVYTGRMLATMSRNAPGIHIESETASKKAIENALKQIIGKTNRDTGKFKTGKFMNTIVQKFVKASTEREINILISGLGRDDLNKFRNQVSNRIRGVKKVIPKGRVGKASKVVVIFAGKTHDFEDELSAKADKMGFSIEIKESFPNKLILIAGKIK